MRVAVVIAITTLAAPAVADDAIDRAAISDVERGELLWHQACPVAEIDGACVQRAAARPAHCGPADDVIVIARDPAKLRDAMGAFRDAASHGAVTSSTARGALALAKLRAADRDYESYLALSLPRGLDFMSPVLRTTSRERFDAWLAIKRHAAVAITEQLEVVVTFHDAATTLAAAARTGQLPLAFANRLLATDTPVGADRETVDAFCDSLVVVAEPLLTAAADAFQSCLVMSDRLSWFDDSARICERELSRMRPQEFPLALEMRSFPTVTPRIEVEGPR